MIALIDAEEYRKKKREISRLWYQNNKERREIYATAKRKERKLWAIDLLGGKCQDCSGVFPPSVYDFHHMDGTKDMNPSRALTYGLERAKEELSKCVLLCSNCHRIRHFEC